MSDKTKQESKKIKKANNSSMAQNLEEVTNLGKEMEQKKTGQEIQEEENLDPDPKQ